MQILCGQMLPHNSVKPRFEILIYQKKKKKPLTEISDTFTINHYKSIYSLREKKPHPLIGKTLSGLYSKANVQLPN